MRAGPRCLIRHEFRGGEGGVEAGVAGVGPEIQHVAVRQFPGRESGDLLEYESDYYDEYDDEEYADEYGEEYTDDYAYGDEGYDENGYAYENGEYYGQEAYDQQPVDDNGAVYDELPADDTASNSEEDLSAAAVDPQGQE